MSKIKTTKVLIYPRKIFKSVSEVDFSEGEVYQISEYDENQNLIKNTLYNNVENTTEMEVYVYNNKNKLIEKKLFINDQMMENYIYEYDENSKLQKEIITYQEDDKIIVSYLYDQNGLLIKEIKSSITGEIEEETNYEYDGDKLIEKKIISAENEIIHRWNGEYNDKGKLIKEYYIEDNIFKGYLYFYNDDGLLKETLAYDNENFLKPYERKIYFFNERNLLEKVILESSIKGLLRSLYYYDDKGNLINFKTINTNDTILHESYYEYNNNNEIVLESFYDIDYENNYNVGQTLIYLHEYYQ